jgi:hypothetical protein
LCAHTLHRHFLVTANASRAAFESKRRTPAAAVEPVANGPVAALMAAIEPPSPEPAADTTAGRRRCVGAVSLQQLTQPMLFNHVQTPGSARVTHRRARTATALRCCLCVCATTTGGW